MWKSKVRMKLLIDTRNKRVLFAEAGKECVDFLFYLLSLPVATVVRLVGAEGMEGSFPTLYKSLENLDEAYIQPYKTKDTHLKPEPAVVSRSSVFLLGLEDPSSTHNKYYRTSSSFRRLTHPDFQEPDESGCLVKGMVMYMVMDDLEVKPMSTISTIALLNDYNVKYVGALAEKVVYFGMDEALKLLKTSLTSKNVLTELFC